MENSDDYNINSYNDFIRCLTANSQSDGSSSQGSIEFINTVKNKSNINNKMDEINVNTAINGEHDNISILKKKKKKNRCSHPDCNKKLPLIPFTCKCELQFCVNHRYAELHNCSFDYKSDGRKKLKMDNPQIIADKLKNRI